MTINIDLLEKVQKIVSHHNCADGTVSAMLCVAAFRSLRPSMDIEFSYYNDKQHDSIKPEPGLMFVDFTPPYAKWPEFRDVGTIVLDHHKSAKPHIVGSNVIFGDGKTESGASLCFKHVLEPMAKKHGHISCFEMPSWKYLSELICIYDTWQQDSKYWQEACNITQGILFLGHKECLHMVRSGKLDIPLLEGIGQRWNKRIKNKARAVAESAVIRDYNGFKIAVYNNTEKITSEVGDELGDKADFSIGYSIHQDGGRIKMLCSFRSRGGFDTTLISRPLGGGGHPGASGALIDIGVGEFPDIERQFRNIANIARNSMNQLVDNVINS